jgi:hypothetical protein
MLKTIKTPSAVAVLREALKRALERADASDVYALLDEAATSLGAPARAQIVAGNAVDQVAAQCPGDVCGLLALASIVEAAHRCDLDTWLASHYAGATVAPVRMPRVAA